jgi:hypothetical protein
LSYADPGAVYEHAAPAVQYVQQPSLFNVSPVTFVRLVQGGALTQDEISSMMGTRAPPVEQGMKRFWDGNFTNCIHYFPTQAFDFGLLGQR